MYSITCKCFKIITGTSTCFVLVEYREEIIIHSRHYEEAIDSSREVIFLFSVYLLIVKPYGSTFNGSN